MPKQSTPFRHTEATKSPKYPNRANINYGRINGTKTNQIVFRFAKSLQFALESKVSQMDTSATLSPQYDGVVDSWIALGVALAMTRGVDLPKWALR